MSSNKPVLRNLHSLIRNTSLTYMNEFVWQDIELTDEFKDAYADYLERNGYSIEFFKATAVISSPYARYIFVPNQWFVISSYAVDVYEELYKYKRYFKKTADRLKQRPDTYAKYLRDNATETDKKEFISCAKDILSAKVSDTDAVEEAAYRLWRFVSDYSWWSGQKTIDRGDFHVSVILNMLNLLNASQGYVGDIVSAYVNDPRLKSIVRSIESFTINMGDVDLPDISDEQLPDERIKDTISETDVCATEPGKKQDRVKIKINSGKTLKEIKFKG